MKSFVWATVAVASSSLVFGACSSDTVESDAGTASDGATASDAATGRDATTAADTSTGPDATVADAAVAPTFTNVYTTVIDGECNGCHSAGHSTGLDMSTKALAYTNLVGKASAAGGNCSGRTRVVASNATTSLLWTKIDHSAGCGNPMPLAKSKLSAAKIALVQDWISAGAKDD